MTSSFIRSLLLLNEAAPEELTVPEITGEVPSGDAISPDDFVEPETPAAGVAPMSTTINAPSTAAMTIQKEVLNKELIKAVTSEMKSVVANFEKQFDKEDMSVRDAEIHITNFLQSLAFQAEKLSSIIGAGNAPEEEIPGPGVEMEMPIAPEPLTEPTLPEEAPMEGEEKFTAPEGEGEIPEFTSPTEVI